MTLTQEITLDIFEAPLFEYINAKQEDNVSRVLVATITANGETLKPDHNKAQAIFRATKPDKTGVMDSATIGEDGKITFALTDQVLAVPGDVAAEIAIVEGDQVLTTATFYIQVERRQGGTGVTSENEFLFLVEATKKAETAAENADAATERANTAAEGADKSRQDADEAEAKRAAAEALRVTAEEGRDTAEQGRVTAEAERSLAEAGRYGAEEARVRNEDDRQTAEDQRASAEEARQEAETGRETAEQVRTEAEANRKEWYEQAAAAVAEALRSMGVAEEYVKSITVSAHPVEAGGEPTAEAGDQDGHLHIDFGLVAGADGVSPMVDVIKEGKTTTVTITDAAGPHTITIQDGKDGTGTGDMEKSVYDPQGKATDVFQAIEDAMKNVRVEVDETPTEGSPNPVSSGGVYEAIQGAGKVTSVNGQTGAVTLNKEDIGLNQVDNTPDSEKEVASAGKVRNALTFTGAVNDSYDGSEAKSVNIPSRPSPAEMFLAAHPVGSYYWSSNATSPASLYGGTWTQIIGQFVLAAGGGYNVNATGGVTTHVHGAGSYAVYLTSNENSIVFQYLNCDLWQATWKVNASSRGADSGIYHQNTPLMGTSGAANNMPPYIVAYCWRRTA